MPRTFWKYVFLETIRLVLIAACVLVVVIAFAVTVKPLGDGKLTAAQAVSFMLLAIPPMLAYALPFAAGFGTTLAYHRLADDNEITAAKAGGLSYRKILAPALAIGVLLAATVGLLNDQVIPRFLTRMEHLITQDLTQVMVNQLGQGQSYAFGDAELHADHVINYAVDHDSPYERQVRLDGLAIVEFEPDTGEVTLEATSSTSWLYIFRAAAMPESDRGGASPDDLMARIYFDDGVAFQDGRYIDLADLSSPAWALPSAFDDDPKYLTGAELVSLREKPERMSFIESRRLDLARALAKAQTTRTVTRKAEETRQLVFNAPAGRTIFVSTSGLEWDNVQNAWTVRPLPGQRTVEIEEQDTDGTVTRSRAEVARLFAENPSTADGLFGAAKPTNTVSLNFRLELNQVEVGTSTGDSRLDAVTQKAEDVFDNLTTEDDPMPRLAALSCAELLTQAEPYQGQDTIDSYAQNLTKRLAALDREVLSKRHERYAMAASCLVMVLTGAVMALKLKDKTPLVIYLWSFFPALATIILIASGQSTTHKDGLIGIPLLWSGVVGLAVYTILTLRNLARR